MIQLALTKLSLCIVGVMCILEPCDSRAIDEAIARAAYYGNPHHGNHKPPAASTLTGEEYDMEEGGRDEDHWNDGSVLAELDIRYTREQWRRFHAENEYESHERHKRKAVPDLVHRWPHRTVFYSISHDFDEKAVEAIQMGLNIWELLTCLTFRYVKGYETDYLRFIKASGCWSHLGMIGEEQKISLGEGCLNIATVIHEIGHAIGLHHEHNRPDRDNYIKIIDENIQDGKGYNFKRMSKDDMNTYSLPYDYMSIMHYSKGTFSKTKGLITIQTKDPAYQDTIGNAQTLSYIDRRFVHKMYCPDQDFGDKRPETWSRRLQRTFSKTWSKMKDKVRGVKHYVNIARHIRHIKHTPILNKIGRFFGK